LRKISVLSLVNGFLLCLLLGIVAAKTHNLKLTGSLFVVLILFPILIRRTGLSLIIICLFGFYLGVFRGSFYDQRLSDYQNYFYNDVVVEGIAQEDSSYNKFGQNEIYLTKVNIEGEGLTGRIRVSFFGTQRPDKGDRVEVRGEIRDGFSSYQAEIRFGELDIVSKDSSAVNNLRKNFVASTYSAVPDPQASLGIGFLIGMRTLLPEDLTNQLQRTGLTHIVAVSGYNLTILVRLVRRLLKKASRFINGFLSAPNSTTIQQPTESPKPKISAKEKKPTYTLIVECY